MFLQFNNVYIFDLTLAIELTRYGHKKRSAIKNPSSEGVRNVAYRKVCSSLLVTPGGGLFVSLVAF